MAISSSQARLETYDGREIDYERAYGDNALKKACTEKAISLLPPGQNVFDAGCGTGKPVSEMLSLAGHNVTGIDKSPVMIHHAESRVKGKFAVADILEYQPETEFAAVFLMFSLLQITAYEQFHAVMFKYARHVEHNGYLVLGTVAGDNYVKDSADYDESGSYAMGNVPFMGGMERDLVFSSEGLVNFISSMGFKIVSNDIGVFQPNDSRWEPEHQQYIIAQRVSEPVMPLPRPVTRTE